MCGAVSRPPCSVAPQQLTPPRPASHAVVTGRRQQYHSSHCPGRRMCQSSMAESALLLRLDGCTSGCHCTAFTAHCGSTPPCTRSTGGRGVHAPACTAQGALTCGTGGGCTDQRRWPRLCSHTHAVVASCVGFWRQRVSAVPQLCARSHAQRQCRCFHWRAQPQHHAVNHEQRVGVVSRPTAQATEQSAPGP
jgi:hypothetical protein